MAIDYNAGITSIDAGAPDIKYTGDEGPKSPDQMKLEGIMQMASDDANERVLEQIFEQLLEEGFSPEEAAIKAKEIFDQRAMATGGRVGFAWGGPGSGRDEKGYQPSHPSSSQSSSKSTPDKRDIAMGHGSKTKKGTITDTDELSKVIKTDLGGGVEKDHALEDQRLENIDITEDFSSPPYPPVKGPWWLKPFQPLSDYNAEINRRYFINNVLRAGKYKYDKYGTLGYEDIGEEDFDIEKAYQQWMADRMSGKIDAVGNVHPDYRREIINGDIVYVPRSGGGDDKAGTTQVPDNQLPTDPGDPDPDPDIPTDSINLANLTQDYTDPSFANPWFYGKGTITLADGGRAGYAGGGIADLRQGYFLGKLVKKITKGAKKALKNPIIRTALLAGIGAYGLKGMGGGTWSPFSGWSMDALKKGAAKTFLKDAAGGWGAKNWNPWTTTVLPAIAGGLYTAMSGDKDEEPEWLKEWKRKYQAGLTEFAPIGQPETWKSMQLYADGGRTGYAVGGYNDDDEEEDHRSAALSAMYGMRRRAQEGGLMDLGGMEKDYRNEGGFVPIGGEERADDVPARLSKNEFVFTADAVRNAGGGDIDKGAEIMENLMENLEKGGKVSEESQGLEGARDMFATAQRLEGVM